jgi:subtilisin family serine protease
VALHATFLGGLILDQAPGATLQFHGVLDAEQGVATSWDVAKAIVALSRTRPDVLNLSMVCYTEDGEPPLAIATAIDAVDRDTVIVAAAGNHGNLKRLPGEDTNREVAALSPEEKKATLARERRKPSWPAALDRVVAVGSADSRDNRSPFTPDDVDWIDVLAVGNKVVSTFHDGDVMVLEEEDETSGRTKLTRTKFNGYAEWGGTSFAAAKVTGAIAALTMPGKRSSQEAWKRVFGPESGARPRFVDIPPVHLA